MQGFDPSTPPTSDLDVEPNPLPNIPHELIIDILTRVPMKSLVKFSQKSFAESSLVHFLAQVGNNAHPLIVDCKINGTEPVPVFNNKTIMHAGQDTYFPVWSEGPYKCSAIWKRHYASFEGYNGYRDGGQTYIIWRINKRGLFLGWDYYGKFKLKKTWKLRKH
ncbi:hypothetical protein ACH5RR_031702 [Cinchona calisaya]|uniref:F-box domain-containing protein n=1 Tax=Cinchona calisaya TaxID=153742 RepID=A0ABD2YK94_9GENT